MTREELITALAAVDDEVTGKKAYGEKAREVVDGLSDDYIAFVNRTFNSPKEWAEYFTM